MRAHRRIFLLVLVAFGVAVPIAMTIADPNCVVLGNQTCEFATNCASNCRPNGYPFCGQKLIPHSIARCTTFTLEGVGFSPCGLDTELALCFETIDCILTNDVNCDAEVPNKCKATGTHANAYDLPHKRPDNADTCIF